jgi:hypothetical protein
VKEKKEKRETEKKEKTGAEKIIETEKIIKTEKIIETEKIETIMERKKKENQENPKKTNSTGTRPKLL